MKELKICEKCPRKLKCILLGPQKVECALYMFALAGRVSCSEFERAFSKLVFKKEI